MNTYIKTSETQQLNILLKNTCVGLFYAALYIVLFYLVIPGEDLNLNFFIWAMIYASISILRKILVINIGKHSHHYADIRKSLLMFNMSLLLSSLCLCYLLFIFDTSWPTVNQIAFWMLIISLIAGSVSLYSIRLLSYLYFCIPLLLCASVLPFTFVDPNYKFLAYLVIMFAIGILYIAKKYSDLFEELYSKEVELAEINKKLESIASKDPLTHLPNRRAYNEYLTSEWDRHKRSASLLSLLIIDVDHFKEYNDNYGHSEGDTCLIRLANIINKNLKRPGDLACRYGGEEFTVILPDTNMKGAYEVSERIRKKIEELKIPHEYSETMPYVTVSIGVATIDPTDDNEPCDLFKQADSNLYEAKQHGRNKVCINTNNVTKNFMAKTL